MPPHTIKPAWATVDPGGLTVRIAPTARDAGWWLFLTALAVFWTGISCYGTVSNGLACATLGIASFSPLLWLLTIGMGLDLGTRRELRLTPAGITLTTTRFGVPSRQDVALRGLKVTPHHQFGAKGFTNTSITLEQPGPPALTVAFALPGALYLGERDAALGALHWLVAAIEEAVPPEA